ncbi:Thioredoxin [Aerococcus viridans]|uniref:Thioredoxin n=2 Tax=Aerococcus viridans TaxID=1377 RepID=A0AAU8U984_9LACT|nr:thioredoxin [Aerococcus viridans]AMC01283.1 thioredoxin [Aerococcus viridans]EFG50162.1 thioredoxin [Aerococcus viridans ATCC 11563 = CCUG 4311]SUU16340.1 Thioredoxin [Aerococcus viridans]
MTVKVTDSTLASEVQDGITLVDFWAPWCGPCKMLGPVLEELAAEFASKIKMAKLNIDENNVTASQLGVISIPTMVLYKDGQPVEKIVGYQPKELLKEYLTEKVTIK